MTPTLKHLSEKIGCDYRHGRPLVLFLDYDGTLTPIVEHPHLARLDRGTGRLLARLARREGVHVSIVSGRSLDDIQALVPARRLYFAGTGGMELSLRGLNVVHPLSQRAAESIDELVLALREAVAGFPGAWVEAKRLGCTVHYRAVALSLFDVICIGVHRAIAASSSAFIAMDGKMAIEITPDIGWNKATAVRLVLDHLRLSDPIVLYAGDAENDAVALAAVNSQGGITIGVGSQAPAAGFRLANSAALVEFLGELDQCLIRSRSARNLPAHEWLAMQGHWAVASPTRLN